MEKINNLGPIEYYIQEVGDDYGGGILENAILCPPLSNDPILKLLRNDWKPLLNNNNKIYIYNTETSTTLKRDEEYNIENTIYTYNPLLVFGKYNNTELFVLFIWQMKWEKALSEGCGGEHLDSKKYLGRNLQDILDYGVDLKDKYMFSSKKCRFEYKHSKCLPRLHQL